jgi:hypothetical protein
VFSVITLATAFWEIVEETKKKKKFEMDLTYVLMLMVSFLPIVNIILAAVSLSDLVPGYLEKNKPSKEKKKKQKELKRIEKQNKLLLQKHPELGVVQTISKILKIYYKEFENEIKFQDTFLSFKEINKYINDNKEKPEVVKLLMEFEITFVRMLAILEDNVRAEKESFYEVMKVANETIDLFTTEVQKIKDGECNLEKLTNEKIKTRHIEELKEDLEFHKKRISSLTV